ncbi:MAG: 4Fe-4S dicluster domain-containing protein [Phycisphaerae bacterium]|nr:4Fe-4S dicluster domain-containing protein [Phycisphaerae bacterium]
MALRLDQKLYERLFDCVHCGFCLGVCPTYAQLGDENDSPRGRLHLMRALVEGRIEPTASVMKHLTLCLDCRACQAFCPSGVKYGSMIEQVRGELAERVAGASKTVIERLIDRLINDVFPDRDRSDRLMLLARLGQAAGMDEFLEQSGLRDVLPPQLARLHAMLPKLGDRLEAIPVHLRPTCEIRARVGFFIGCVSESMFGPTNRATLRVLLANGVEVFAPPAQVCCGAIHHHNNKPDVARQLARLNIDVFGAIEGGVDAVVTNVAGCGAMLKEYGELLADDREYADRAKRFVERVRDISEFLVGLGIRPPTRAMKMKVTYHDACHLAHAQGITKQPRELLRSIPGLEIVPLPESDMCCGAAGTYNLTQPKMSDRLAERKLSNIDKTGAGVVAAANAGCLLQISQHARRTGRDLRVVHPIDLLAEAYGDDGCL